MSQRLLNIDPNYSERLQFIRNREKVQAPHRGWFWCEYCDRQLVREQTSCPICGGYNGIRKFRLKHY